MDHIEENARVSVGRGCGFALLAIVCTMVGLSGTPVIALKAGGILCLLTAVVLVLKAQAAPTRPYKRTEVWLMLDEGRRPPEAYAQRLIAAALVASLQDHALKFAKAAGWMLAAAFLLRLVKG